MWVLHVGHEKSDELVDVVCRLEGASAVRQFSAAPADTEEDNITTYDL